MTLVRLLAGAELSDEPARAATLMRWTMLMMHLYYLAVDGPVEEFKWKLLRERGLVLPHEETELNQLSKKPSAGKRP